MLAEACDICWRWGRQGQLGAQIWTLSFCDDNGRPGDWHETLAGCGSCVRVDGQSWESSALGSPEKARCRRVLRTVEVAGEATICRHALGHKDAETAGNLGTASSLFHSCNRRNCSAEPDDGAQAHVRGPHVVTSLEKASREAEAQRWPGEKRGGVGLQAAANTAGPAAAWVSRELKACREVLEAVEDPGEAALTSMDGSRQGAAPLRMDLDDKARNHNRRVDRAVCDSTHGDLEDLEDLGDHGPQDIQSAPEDKMEVLGAGQEQDMSAMADTRCRRGAAVAGAGCAHGLARASAGRVQMDIQHEYSDTQFHMKSSEGTSVLFGGACDAQQAQTARARVLSNP